MTTDTTQRFTFTSPLRRPAPLAAFLLELAYPHPSDGSRLMLEIMDRGGSLEFIHDNAGDLVPAADGGYGIRSLGERLSPKERADALRAMALELEHKTAPGPTRVSYGPRGPHLIPCNSVEQAGLDLLLFGRALIRKPRQGKPELWVPASAMADEARVRFGVDLARDDSAVVEFTREYACRIDPYEPEPPAESTDTEHVRELYRLMASELVKPEEGRGAAE